MRRGRAAVNIAFEKANGALARRVVAEGDVDMGIDQARDGDRAVRVDHDVAVRDLRGGGGPDVDDLALVHDDRVARRERLAPIASQNCTEIDDGCFHSNAALTFRDEALIAARPAP